jgi:uncharacterized protein (UPF0303 family)
VVELFHRSSYAIGLALTRDQTTLEAKLGVDARDYAAHGGSFPLQIQGVGCVGAITVSGLTQCEDYTLVVTVLAEQLGQPLAMLVLESY